MKWRFLLRAARYGGQDRGKQAARLRQGFGVASRYGNKRFCRTCRTCPTKAWLETAYKRPFAGAPKQPMMVVLFTPASCERVARERAGGERGWLFAGQKANRVHPSIAAASEASAATLRLALSAGRANLKDRPQTSLLYLRKRQKGCGEKRRAFPREARSAAGCGAGRGPAP